MGRGKVQMKRIEATSARRATFLKRKGGLMKKAKDLSVLCSADVGVIIFSGGGDLYEFCNQNCLEQLLDRYDGHMDAERVETELEKISPEQRSAFFLQLVTRYLESDNIENLDLKQLERRERQLDRMIRQTRRWKSKVVAKSIAALGAQRDQLLRENRQRQEDLMPLRQKACGSSGPVQVGQADEPVAKRPDLNSRPFDAL